MAEINNRWESGTYKLGDLQEHKYTNQKAWIPGALSHADTDTIENVHTIVYDHFDPDKGDFKGGW